MPKRYNIIFNFVALSIMIYIGVDIFYTVVEARLRQRDTNAVVAQPMTDSSKAERPPLNHYQLIMGRNIFGSKTTPSDNVEPEDIEALEPTTLSIALLGTVSGSPRNTYAVIEETNKKKQGLFRVGDDIQGGSIKKILRGKVILSVEDRDEILTMEESAKRSREKGPVASRPRRGSPSRSSRTGSRTVTVRRSDVEASLADINKLMTEVRVRPHYKDGQPDGLAISRIKAGSFFSKLGLRDGDVVQEVNGSGIKSPDDILSLYQQLKSGSEVGLQIDRKGRQETINYKFR
ncbi:MAG: PDZ domain-containing protein [Deltaproteobacteria bacterium]|nr:PDZ domain-containing protein [Deltaproteobacteria bacterium]